MKLTPAQFETNQAWVVARADSLLLEKDKVVDVYALMNAARSGAVSSFPPRYLHPEVCFLAAPPVASRNRYCLNPRLCASHVYSDDHPKKDDVLEQ